MVAGASFLQEKASGWNSRYLTFPFFAAIVIVLGVAAAVSLFHLGRPGRAIFALSNLKDSWLSREILFELLFIALTACLALLISVKTYRPTLIRILLVLAGGASVLFFVCMSRIYMMRTVPAWRGFYTPLSFLGSTLLLGSLGAASSYDWLLDLGRRVRPFLDASAVIALAAVVLILFTIFLFSPGLGLFRPKKATLLELPPSKMYPALIVRLVFLLGAVLFCFLYGKSHTSWLLTPAFLCAAAAEGAGRYLFYAVRSRLGV